jgi:hypothetical protein
MNHWGLDLKRTSQLAWLERGEPRRVFMAGGSDAHGDLNYRRTGYFLHTTGTNDTAIGTPRNLLFVGEPAVGQDVRINERIWSAPYAVRRYTQEQTVEALREGRFAVTDGPALRIAVDRNGNAKIDDGDTQLGGIVRISELLPMRIKLLIEWISTPEFGPVSRIDVYVGTRTTREFTDPDETSRARTYAPHWHGARDMVADPPSVPRGSYSSAAITYTEMADGYWLDPTAALQIDPDVRTPAAYNDVKVLDLDLDRFEAARGVPGDRLFIRAFAKTGPGNGIPRYAFTNPIWIVRQLPVFK